MIGGDAARDLYAAMRATIPGPEVTTRLATVTGGTATTVSVQFDGEATASARAYPKTYAPAVGGDRVVMVRTGSTWTAVGRIPTSVALNSPDTGWITPTLLNGFTHYDGGTAPHQYRRFNGTVHFRGLLGGGNGPNLDAYSLDPGYRGYWLRGNCHFQTTRGDVAFLVRVWNTGAVQPSLNGSYIDLANITFIADA